MTRQFCHHDYTHTLTFFDAVQNGRLMNGRVKSPFPYKSTSRTIERFKLQIMHYIQGGFLTGPPQK